MLSNLQKSPIVTSNAPLLRALVIRFLRVLLGISLSVLITRNLGIEILGQFAAVEKYIGTALVASSVYTLPYVVSRFAKAREICTHVLRTHAGLYAVIIVTMIICVLLSSTEPTIETPWIFFALGGLFEVTLLTLSFFLVASKRIELAGLAETTLKLFLLNAIVLVFGTKLNFTTLALVYFIACSVSLATVFWLALRGNNAQLLRTHPVPKIDFYFYSSRLVNFILRNANILLASFILSSAEVGHYSIAIKISFAFALLYQITTNWRFPHIQAALDNKTPLNFMVTTSRFCFLFSVIIFVLIAANFSTVISFWGFNAPEIRSYFIILVLGQIVNVCVGPVEQVLLLVGDAQWNAKFNVVSLVCQASAMTYFGIVCGIYGVLGAEIVTFIAGNIVRYARLRAQHNIVVGCY